MVPPALSLLIPRFAARFDNLPTIQFRIWLQSVGSSTDKTFTITNNTNSRVFGNIILDGPFTIVGDSAYNIAPGQSQTFTSSSIPPRQAPLQAT